MKKVGAYNKSIYCITIISCVSTLYKILVVVVKAELYIYTYTNKDVKIKNKVEVLET